MKMIIKDSFYLTIIQRINTGNLLKEDAEHYVLENSRSFIQDIALMKPRLKDSRYNLPPEMIMYEKNYLLELKNQLNF